jgi:hypothetical protein
MKNFILLYSSPNIIRMIKSEDDEMIGACNTHGEMKNGYKIVDGNSDL